jgi:hypothetical protein
MLQNEAESVNWNEVRNIAIDGIPKELKPYIVRNKSIQTLVFPIIKYPEKVKSLNLSKSQLYKGKLIGIKGQYLIFEDSTVFNVRSHEGYSIELNVF